MLKNAAEVAIAITAIVALVFSCQSNATSRRAVDEAKRSADQAQRGNDIAQRALEVTALAPFDPIVVASDPLWVVEETRGGNVKLALVATAVITNRGAVAGCFGEIVAVLKFPGSDNGRRLRANYFVNPERALALVREGAKGKPRPLYEAHEAPFAPIVVLGRGNVAKTIVFRHPRVRRDSLRGGKYEFELIGSSCDEPASWRRLWKRTYVIEEQEARAVRHGHVTVFESEERIEGIRSVH